jgi:ABC-type multidrug transport system fused ATPase/permease subunit
LKRSNPLSLTLKILTTRDKTLLSIFSLSQILLSCLDLVGIALLGLITLIGVSKDRSGFLSNSYFVDFLEILRLEQASNIQLITAFSLFTAFILITKTLLSLFLIRTTFKFLALKASNFSADLSRRVYSFSLPQIQKYTSQEIAYGLTTGVERAVLGVLGTSITLVADMSLVLVISVGLMLVNFQVAVFTLIYFSLIAFVIHATSNRYANSISLKLAKVNISGTEKIIEAVGNFRDLIVKNQQSYYSDLVKRNRIESNKYTYKMSYLPFLGKYIIESSIILGILILGVFLFNSQTSTYAISTLTIFISSSARLAPSILRVQQGFLQIQYSSGLSEVTLKLDEESRILSTSDRYGLISITNEEREFVSKISAQKLKFKYDNSSQFSLEVDFLEILPGQVTAIVGSSGSGKSTLADLLTGVLPADSGTILISDHDARSVHQVFPGVVGYVPQSTLITQGSIMENVALGFASEFASEKQVYKCLEKAQLLDFVNSLPLGLYTLAGEWGQRISGGQRQRLGIARALFTDPKILVLDEATSSLDSETEDLLTNSINELRGETTIVIVAHRLATVRTADNVIYMENGKVRFSGKFDDVRNAVPSFNHQAEILGL